MIVVSDTSPLTSLLQVGHCHLLESLFGRALVPRAVQAELLRFRTSLPPFVETRSVRGEEAVAALAATLDRGEAEAIVLAEQCQADALLMDEKRGRAVAQSRGLCVIGLLGVLLLAKEAGLIASVRQLMGDLESQAGFFVSDSIRQMILNAAEE